jgi:hypothetical protein
MPVLIALLASYPIKSFQGAKVDLISVFDSLA